MRDSTLFFLWALIIIVFLILPDPLFHVFIEGSDWGLPPVADFDYPNIIRQMFLYFPNGTILMSFTLIVFIWFGYEFRKMEG